MEPDPRGEPRGLTVQPMAHPLTRCARVFASFWCTGAALLVWVLPLDAQVITGRVSDGSTGSGLATVFVTLHDEGGERVAGDLTTADGRYRLRAASPGSYRLRAQRIGYGDYESPALLDLGAGDVTAHDIALPAQAIPLAGIVVEGGETRCTVRPGEGLRTAQVWDEARKALEVAVWTQSERLVRYAVTNYRTVVDVETDRVVHEERSTGSGYTAGSPYESLDPEDLAREGYVRSADGGGWLYYAPDAEVLLSDAFVDRHCFELVEHESDRSLLGLAFRPVSRSGSADIRGVLWLNRESAELDRLEFSYTDLPFPVESSRIGGEVEFERLPDGPWIVRSWRIRAPEVALGRSDVSGRTGWGGAQERFRVVRVDETGGVVERAIVTGGVEAEPATTRTTLSGIVLDPTGSMGVADARVRVEGEPDTATTGPDGRFRIDGLRPGRYRLRIESPEWDAPWSPPATAEFAVGAGSPEESEFRLAPPSDVVAAWCGPTAESRGVLFGRVLHPETGSPLPEADVVVAWRRITEMGARRDIHWEALSGISDSDGWYRICDVPSDEVVRVRAVPGYGDRDRVAERLWRPDTRLPLDARELSLGETLRARMDLGLVDLGLVDVPERASAPESAVAVDRAAAEEIRARVVDEVQREAIADAAVTLLTTDSVELASTTTGGDGFFLLPAEEQGRYVVRVEAPGFETAVREVDVDQALLTIPAFVLTTTVFPIEGIDVEVERTGDGAPVRVEGAVGRRANVLAGERLAALDKNGVSFVSAVRNLGDGPRVRNVMIEREQSYPCIESGRGPVSMRDDGSDCRLVAIVIDGVDTGISRSDPGTALRFLRSLDLSEFESMEYLSPVQAGSRYGMEASAKGALVLWTRGTGPYRSSARDGGGS